MTSGKHRVLYVTTSTTVGGAEKDLYHLCALINKERFEVAGVISLKPAGAYAQKLEEAGFQVESMGMGRVPMPWDPLRLAGLIRKYRPDLVHALMYKAMQLCRMARPLGRFKLVSSPHVNYRSRPGALVALDRILRGADDLAVLESETTARYMAEKLGYRREKLVAVHNALDPEDWNPSRVDRQMKRLELGLHAMDLVLIGVGRLDVQKGHTYLLQAMAALGESHPTHLILAGGGPLQGALEKEAADLGLGERAHFVGEVENVAPWLSAADIFVLPSLWEGLPIALLEAMAMGLPVLASNVDGVPEAVEDGRTGLLAAPGKPEELAAGLRRLIDDPDLRRRLGEGAREKVRREFVLEKMVRGYEEAYLKVLEG